MAYIIYCDESDDKGERFRDFFGGCIINSADQYEITQALEKKKEELNLLREVKWTRVSSNYLEKYIELIDLFFDFVQAGKIKIRIMFRSTADAPSDISKATVDDKYFKLYYQFLKHSFGLMTIPKECTPANIIIYMDVLPDKHGKRQEFKEFLYNMPLTSDFYKSGISIDSRYVIEVDSKKHVILQCVDIVLGAMQFKLNQLDKAKPAGQARRGKRTIAKAKLFKHIYKRICGILPYFNPEVSTGNRDFANPHWDSPYEHWRFQPK